MEATLLDRNSIALVQTNKDLSVDDLLTNHQKLMDNNIDINMKTMELIRIMGGMDIVLQGYLLNAKANKINNYQINQINNVFLSLEHNVVETKLEKQILNVHKQDTFIHGLFAKTRAQKIMNFIHNPIVSVIFGAIAILNFSLMVWRISVWLFMLGCIVWIIYMLFQIMSLHRTITKMIACSFEFWFKLLYLIKMVACGVIIVLQCDPGIGYLYDMFIFVLMFLFFISYSFLDGLQISRKYKLFILIIGLIPLMWFAAFYTYRDTYRTIDSTKDDKCFYLELFDARLNIYSWMTNAMQVITIFMCKQTVKSIRNKNTATLIHNSVLLNWYE
eukprot:554943_1